VIMLEAILRNRVEKLSTSESKFRHLLDKQLYTRTLSSLWSSLSMGIIVLDRVPVRFLRSFAPPFRATSPYISTNNQINFWFLWIQPPIIQNHQSS
jgi:hypothetical protein